MKHETHSRSRRPSLLGGGSEHESIHSLRSKGSKGSKQQSQSRAPPPQQQKHQNHHQHHHRHSTDPHGKRWDGVTKYQRNDDYITAARHFYDTPSQNSAVIETVYRRPKIYADLHEYDDDDDNNDNNHDEGNRDNTRKKDAAASHFKIDRVPTAIGYHSMDSADEIYQAKSNLSRYEYREPEPEPEPEPQPVEPEEMSDINSLLDGSRASSSKRHGSVKSKRKNKEQEKHEEEEEVEEEATVDEDARYGPYREPPPAPADGDGTITNKSNNRMFLQSVNSIDSDSCPPIWKSFDDGEQNDAHDHNWRVAEAKRIRELNSVSIPASMLEEFRTNGTMRSGTDDDHKSTSTGKSKKSLLSKKSSVSKKSMASTSKKSMVSVSKKSMASVSKKSMTSKKSEKPIDSKEAVEVVQEEPRSIPSTTTPTKGRMSRVGERLRRLVGGGGTKTKEGQHLAKDNEAPKNVSKATNPTSSETKNKKSLGKSKSATFGAKKKGPTATTNNNKASDRKVTRTFGSRSGSPFVSKSSAKQQPAAVKKSQQQPNATKSKPPPSDPPLAEPHSSSRSKQGGKSGQSAGSSTKKETEPSSKPTVGGSVRGTKEKSKSGASTNQNQKTVSGSTTTQSSSTSNKKIIVLDNHEGIRSEFDSAQRNETTSFSIRGADEQEMPPPTQQQAISEQPRASLTEDYEDEETTSKIPENGSSTNQTNLAGKNGVPPSNKKNLQPIQGFSDWIMSGFDGLANMGYDQPVLAFLDWSGEERKIAQLAVAENDILEASSTRGSISMDDDGGSNTIRPPQVATTAALGEQATKNATTINAAPTTRRMQQQPPQSLPKTDGRNLERSAFQSTSGGSSRIDLIATIPMGSTKSPQEQEHIPSRSTTPVSTEVTRLTLDEPERDIDDNNDGAPLAHPTSTVGGKRNRDHAMNVEDEYEALEMQSQDDGRAVSISSIEFPTPSFLLSTENQENDDGSYSILGLEKHSKKGSLSDRHHSTTASVTPAPNTTILGKFRKMGTISNNKR